MTNFETKNLFLSTRKPVGIVRWIIGTAKQPVIFTNFRPSSIALIHLVKSVAPNIPVVWIDSGFNTDATYRYVDKVVDDLALNLVTYTPLVSTARWSATYGDVPEIDSPLHEEFSELVKLEPFKRAIRDLSPDFWFTGIRKGQTKHRDKQGILSNGPSGSIKVAPFIDHNETQIEQYILDNGLPTYLDYYDPTKGPQHRECGLQLLA